MTQSHIRRRVMSWSHVHVQYKTVSEDGRAWLAVASLVFRIIVLLCFTRASLFCVNVSYFVFCVFPVCCCLVVASTSATYCLERLVCKIAYYMQGFI